MVMRAAFVLSTFVAGAQSHGAMTFPRPRNALDGDLAPWTNWSFPCDATHQKDMCAIGFCCGGKDCQGSCGKSAHNGVKGSLTGANGQACYYFSNGCTPGPSLPSCLPYGARCTYFSHADPSRLATLSMRLMAARPA